MTITTMTYSVTIPYIVPNEWYTAEGYEYCFTIHNLS